MIMMKLLVISVIILTWHLNSYMKSSKGEPIVLVNLFFIVAIMIWAAVYYVNHVQELREVIDVQDEAIQMQRVEIDMLNRVFLPGLPYTPGNTNPLYRPNYNTGDNSNANMNNE